MKKLSTVLLALSMLFGSDVDARRARGAKAGKKGISAKKGSELTGENLIQKILGVSAGEKSDLDALRNVAKTLSGMVEKNPGILTQVQDIMNKVESEEYPVGGKGKKGRKGKKALVKKIASKLASELGKLIPVQNPNNSPNDSFAEVAKKAGFQDAKSLEEMQALLNEVFAYSVKTDVKPEEQAKVNEAKAASKLIQENLSKALGANVKAEEVVGSFEAIVSSLGGKFAGFKVVDAATPENAPAKFDTLLKNSKLIAEVNKEIDLSRRFSEGLKFNSEKLVKDLNAALAEKDETKKFEALKTLFASLDSQYETLTALAPTLEVVFSEIRKAVQSSGEFNATADVEKKVKEMYLTYNGLSVADQATYLKGIKNFSESVSSMNQAEKKDNFKSLNDNTYFDYKNLSGLSAYRQVIVTVTGNKDAGKSLNDVKALLTKKAVLTADDLRALETVSGVYADIFDGNGDIKDTFGISKSALDSFKTEIKDVLQSASKKVAESLTVEWNPGSFLNADAVAVSANFATFGTVIETDRRDVVFTTQDNIGRKASLRGTKVAKDKLLFGDGTSLVRALMGSANLATFEARPEVVEFLQDLGRYRAPAFLTDLKALLLLPCFRCTNAANTALAGIVIANGDINVNLNADNGLGRVIRNDLVTILEMAQGKTTSRFAEPAAANAANIANLIAPVTGNDLDTAVNAAKKVVHYFNRY